MRVIFVSIRSLRELGKASCLLTVNDRDNSARPCGQSCREQKQMRHVLHFVGINSEPTRKVDAGMAAEYDQVHRCACQPGRIEGTTTARALNPFGQRRPHGRLHLSSCWLEGQSVTGTFWILTETAVPKSPSAASGASD